MPQSLQDLDDRLERMLRYFEDEVRPFARQQQWRYPQVTPDQMRRHLDQVITSLEVLRLCLDREMRGPGPAP